MEHHHHGLVRRINPPPHFHPGPTELSLDGAIPLHPNVKKEDGLKPAPVRGSAPGPLMGKLWPGPRGGGGGGGGTGQNIISLLIS